jgi:LruC domain-containing protein
LVDFFNQFFYIERLGEYIVTPLSTSEVGDMPYNPYLFSTVDPGKEVHLPDHPPTSGADMTYFNTQQDDSSFGAGRYYQRKNNLPWALHIPGEWAHPVEKRKVTQGYPVLLDWAHSRGQSFKDWYRRDLALQHLWTLEE